jgi:hypothetical protein
MMTVPRVMIDPIFQPVHKTPRFLFGFVTEDYKDERDQPNNQSEEELFIHVK